MALDLVMFKDKLMRYCSQLEVSLDELSQGTGIPLDRLKTIAGGNSEPTGDEVLILADFFKCDFKFFISNEKLAPFEQTESLFRKHGSELTREDRWAIQEFLFLCECQEFLMANMPHIKTTSLCVYENGEFLQKTRTGCSCCTSKASWI